MVEKVFWQDPGLTQLDSEITAIDGDTIEVARTIFFAFSGGQESDAGTIAGRAVLAAVKDGTAIRYRLDDTAGLSLGDIVTIAIDGDRRARLMRLHFAAELILELVYRARPGIEKTGAHIAPDKARIDFAWRESLKPHFETLRGQAQAIIDADLAIDCDFEDKIAERRYWRIEGFAKVPCGGTHPATTGGVGTIRLKRKNLGKHRERIEIYVDGSR